jgi:hypothetical protein
MNGKLIVDTWESDSCGGAKNWRRDYYNDLPRSWAQWACPHCGEVFLESWPVAQEEEQ